MSKTTTVVFATDVHGSDICFRKFLASARAYGADVLILGGDICGKQIVPIIQDGTGWTADVFGQSRRCATRADVADVVREIRGHSAYAWVTTADDWHGITADPEAQDRLFERLSGELVAEWIELAETRLAGTGVRCIIGAGNDDPLSIDEVIRASSYVEMPDWEYLDIAGFPMLTIGDANPTPWRSPRELPEDELQRRLRDYADGISDYERAIFTFHVPPYDSGLDIAPEIDDQFRVQYSGSEPRMAPVGSTAVRWCIEHYQPLLGLHGHVHESQGATRLGRSLCLNPGSDYKSRTLRAALVRLDEKRGLRAYQFTAG